jgi:hypothetical protein
LLLTAAEQRWARSLPFALTLTVAAYLVIQGAVLSDPVPPRDDAPWTVALILLAAWYCFFKRSVADYYTRLAAALAAA